MKKLPVVIVGLALWAAAPSLQAQTAADHLRAGDSFSARFEDARALAEYEQAAKLEPANFEALWKTGQACLNVADRIGPHDQNQTRQKLRLYDLSRQHLRQAIRIKPDDSRVHVLYASALGRQARAADRKQQVALAYTIKAEIDRALALDPRNDLAWHALAYWHRTLAEVGGASRFLGGILFGSVPRGSFDEAVKDFQKAIALNPNSINHHIELARTYLDLRQRDLAAREFRIALECPNTSSMAAHFKERARQELERLKTSEDVSFEPGSDFLS